ncbi:DNA primase [uncultured Xylophilus sp.]|uniref:DNA primase n=1 Tax=uncultured Xylophilus sp. TaxID=296832 RepID=UPI0025E27EA0|nr:DNA primase [uncultured Xylophilus sp.]
MAIPQSFIQELLARTDVVDVVGKHVQLKKGGANFMGLCPFHDEKSPSFSVSPAKQFYHCFGCGASGDAIKFLTAYTGATFVEAVHDLAQQNGMQVPEDNASAEDRARAAAQRQKQVTLHDVLDKAGEAYRRHLKSSPRAVEYLKGRGLSGDIAKRFGLGYAPEGWRALASVFPAYDDPLLVESGLVIAGEDDGHTPESERKRYDRFRDRVMFPIRNVKGECIGFGGRVLGDEKPKYLNSPETPVFSKGRELYGLFEARAALRDSGHALVTEGYMDVVALAQLGFPNAVATLGTACTADHVQKLFRFTDTIVFSFDGDAAGRRAARKALDAALPFATDIRAVKFLFLPQEHDPDSFVRAHGRDAFAQYVADALPLSRFLLEAARDGCDLDTAEGRARMASQARPLWNLLPDGALRRQLVGEIAAQVQLDARELTELWTSAAAQERRPRAGRDSASPSGRRSREAPQTGGDTEDDGWHSHEPSWNRGFGDGGRDDHYGSTRRGPRSGGSSHRLPPVTRADHAARLLLLHVEALDSLSHEEREMLCALPAPHGALFLWLEGQLHEHGAQPWAALREGLRGHEAEDLATRVLSGPHAEGEADARELRGLLTRMQIEQIEEQERMAIADAGADPAALQRYKALHARLLALRATLVRTS